MKFLYDFFPLLLFLVALLAFDIYVATAVAVVAAVLQVSWNWYRTRKFETMHLVTLAVIVFFGGATLILHDDTFIRWKPTVVYWIFTVILIGSHFIGKKTAMERLMGKNLELPAKIWGRMNFSFAIFTLLMGVLNLYVAFVYGADLDPKVQLEHWAYFKVFGSLILTFLFVFILMLTIQKHIKVEPEAESPK